MILDRCTAETFHLCNSAPTMLLPFAKPCQLLSTDSLCTVVIDCHARTRCHGISLDGTPLSVLIRFANRGKRSAAGHAKRWGCWWNRDMDAIVQASGLVVVEQEQHHFGTTYVFVLRPGASAG